MHKILLVEDEKNFAQVLKDYLAMSSFSVTLCANGEEGIEAFRNGKFDLCIVDIMMPKKDGFTLCAEIRAIDRNIPLIFLTARTMREDQVRAYKTGADDYIIKPFDSEVLLLKINAIMNRKHSTAENAEYLHEMRGYRFNAQLRSLMTPAGREVKLSPKESELLNLLCQHRNGVLPRQVALRRIW
jgi:DNA-binding response OmpR family regulator